MVRKIDFHAHVLPGSDHGCRNVSMALEQLHMAGKAGIDLVVAVSHFYAHEESVEHFLMRREQSYEKLLAGIEENGHKEELPQVIRSAEVLVCQGMEHMEGLERLCAIGTDAILLEMPFGKWGSGLVDTMEELIQIPDIRPILAHVDRYDREAVEQLFDMGYCGQLNAEPFSKLFPPRYLLRWVKEGHIYALGSDIHGTKTGYRDFLKAEKAFGKYLDEVMERSAKLLAVE